MNSNRSILTKYKINVKKHMGQNFLETTSLCNSIITQLGIANDDIVLEVGPGLGALTVPAAKLAKKLFAIEKDSQLVEILRNRLLLSEITNVNLITGDVLKTDFYNIYKKANQKLLLVGNLPYNISSKMLIKTIQDRNIIKKAIFMLQKEVANRLCSKPGSKSYGRLSVILQYYAKICILFEVNPSMFFPKPKIKSSVVKILFRDKPKLLAKNEKLLSSVIKAAFAKRRKTLKNSLSESLENIDSKVCKEVLLKSGIDPMRRAETLSVEEFVFLSNCFYEKKLLSKVL